MLKALIKSLKNKPLNPGTLGPSFPYKIGEEPIIIRVKHQVIDFNVASSS